MAYTATARTIEVEANGKKYLGVIYNDHEQVDIYYDPHMDESSDDDGTRAQEYGSFQDLRTIYDGAGDYTVTAASGLTDDCITPLWQYRAKRIRRHLGAAFSFALSLLRLGQ